MNIRYHRMGNVHPLKDFKESEIRLFIDYRSLSKLMCLSRSGAEVVGLNHSTASAETKRMSGRPFP